MKSAPFGLGARLVLDDLDNSIALLRARPDLLTDATAAAVRRAAGHAEQLMLRDTDSDTNTDTVSLVLRSRALSEWVHRELGRPEEAAADRLRRLEVIHQVTDDLETYDSLQRNAVEVAAEAAPLGRQDLVVQATYLAADAGYWGALKASGAERQSRILAACELLVGLSPLQAESLPAGTVHQLTTLCAVLCDLQAQLGPVAEPALADRDSLLRAVFGPDADPDRLLERASMRAPTIARADGLTRVSRLFDAADADESVGAYLMEVLGRAERTAAEVLEAAELGSARTLLDGMADRWPQTGTDARVRELEREVTAYPSSSHTDPLMRELALVSGLPFGVGENEKTRRREAARALDARVRELGMGVEFHRIAVQAKEVQALLGAGEVLIRYVLPYHPLHPAYLAHAVVVTRSELRLVQLRVPESDGSGTTGAVAIDGRAPVELSPLGNAVTMARLAAGSLLPERGADPGHLVELDDMVLAPVRETGLLDGARHLVIVPQRALHLAPWMALRSGEGRWLIDDVSVSLAPSASVWAALRRTALAPVTRTVLVGDVDATAAGLERLPGSARQVEFLELFLTLAGVDVRALSGQQATFERLRQAIAGAQVLDIAAHGSFPDETSLFDHAFHLTPDLRSDGRVTADQVRALHLDAASVVLGVCNGGAYRVGPGDEPYGLVPAFLEAGAVNVIAAQWPVADELAADLLIQVGTDLPRLGAAEALRRGILGLRDGIGDAAASLGFVCVGDGSAPVRD